MSMFNGYPAIRICAFNESQPLMAWVFVNQIVALEEEIRGERRQILRHPEIVTTAERYVVSKQELDRVIALLDAVREDGRSRDYRPEDHIKEDESEGGIVLEPALREVWGQSVIRPEDITQTREDQRTEDYWRGFHEGLEAQDLSRVEARQEPESYDEFGL